MNYVPHEGRSSDFWNTTAATEDTLKEVSIEFQRNAKFTRFIKYWEMRGTKAESISQLLHLYYSTVTVVRIPRKGRSNLMKEQIQELYRQINRCVDYSHQAKADRGMLMNAETLHAQFQSAFDHYTTDLTTAFDFVKATLAYNPIPSDFSGSILKLILEMKKQCRLGIEWKPILETVAPFIASCIMIETAREALPGMFQLVPSTTSGKTLTCISLS